MPADQRRLRLLELKRTARLATDSELAELREAYSILGEGLAVPMVRLAAAEWEAKYGGERLTLYVDVTLPAEPPPPPTVTRLPNGLVLCEPGFEPIPAGRENLKHMPDWIEPESGRP